MVIYDITLPIDANLPVWPGDDGVTLGANQRIAEGDLCNVSNIHIGCHNGTHIDSSWHFVDSGNRVKDIDINLLVGRVLVLDLSNIDGNIQPEHLKDVPNGTKRLIIRTANSISGYTQEFNSEFIGITPESAEFLVDKGVELLGLDYLSFAALTADITKSHRIFLNRHGVVGLEGLVLKDITAGYYKLMCMPLLLDLDGSPARVMLETLD